MGFCGSSVSKESAFSVQEIQVPSLDQEDPLEKEMATHPSILAWKNTRERGAWAGGGRVQSMGSHRVGHDLVTKPPPKG